MCSQLFRSLVVLVLSASALAQTPPTSVQVPGAFVRPTWAGSPPGDARIFVTEQFSGQVHVIKNGAQLGTPFLDIGLLVLGQSGERGLLSMAFHPDYAHNGFFYVFYTRNTDGAIFVERYKVSAANPDVADINSGSVMLGPVPHSANNHNGGMLAFDPNGYLYVTLGDNDAPPCNALNGQSLFGKVLRLDVSAGGQAAPGNPFLGDPNFDDRIWAYEMSGGVAINQQERIAEVAAGVWGVTGFGVDGCGEILIAGHGSGSIWKVLPAAEPPSAPYCFGDGTGAQCPCSASGAPGGGCLNSGGAGAELTGSGTPSFSADSLVFDVVGVPGSKPGLLLRGNNQVANQVGDGLLCAAGQSQRSSVQVTTASGTTTYMNFDLAGGSPWQVAPPDSDPSPMAPEPRPNSSFGTGTPRAPVPEPDSISRMPGR